MSHPRFFLRIFAVAVALILVWHFSGFQESYSSSGLHGLAKQKTVLPCDSLKGLEDVFLIVRTGANEAPEKLPAHFDTTLRCLPKTSYGIWSDLEEEIGGYHVGNALDEIPGDIIKNNADFAYYRRLQEKGRTAFSSEEIASWATAPNSASGRDTPGWKLDKWKFLPLADKAYRQRPDAKWFIYTECDGYINWTNMLHWLDRLDSSKPYYLGMQMQIGDVVFAYGGASFVISNQAMKKLVNQHATNPGVYEDFTSHHWAGDCVLGKVLKDAGVELSWAWPTFFGDMPFDMDYNATFGAPDVHPWCYNAMTWHHLGPADLQEVAAYEQKWNLEHSKLLRHGDVFRNLVLPKIAPVRESWNNLSADEESSKKSIEACRQACRSQSTCIQFSYEEGTQTCKVSTVLKLGHAETKKRVTSGWMMDRIEAFAAEMESQCHGQDWQLPPN
ncbi:hypothetical protein BX600DRAFT_517523 [Xylariales sp. PMI_506]|nr:hypothetical protein BX600DRAFT_517523 [Xylariales sp. PMI_506]